MRAALFLLIPLACLAACNHSPTAPSAATASTPSPPPPTTGAPPIPTGSHSLTGVITEKGPQGDRPLGGANVNAWVQTSTIGYSYMWAHGPRLTDSDGRYQLTNLPQGATVQLEVYKQGFVQQCAAPQFVVNGQHHLDAQLVARTNVSASRDSVPPSAAGFRIVSGVVYEITNEGRRPAPEAFVDYEPTMDSPAALTYTDALGRFLLCGIPEARPAMIGAALGAGRFAYKEVPSGLDAEIEIEIR
jgi:hypothetical protein